MNASISDLSSNEDKFAKYMISQITVKKIIYRNTRLSKLLLFILNLAITAGVVLLCILENEYAIYLLGVIAMSVIVYGLFKVSLIHQFDHRPRQTRVYPMNVIL